jgi:hypothetical protein
MPISKDQYMREAEIDTIDYINDAFNSNDILQTTKGGTGNSNGTVAKLTTSRTLQVNLASTTAGSFDGSSNIQIGTTTNPLPISTGGTGATAATAARDNLGITDLLSVSDYISLNDNVLYTKILGIVFVLIIDLVCGNTGQYLVGTLPAGYRAGRIVTEAIVNNANAASSIWTGTTGNIYIYALNTTAKYNTQFIFLAGI